eukprot:6269924-Amphidinium_carterae.2
MNCPLAKGVVGPMRENTRTLRYSKYGVASSLSALVASLPFKDSSGGRSARTAHRRQKVDWAATFPAEVPRTCQWECNGTGPPIRFE